MSPTNTFLSEVFLFLMHILLISAIIGLIIFLGLIVWKILKDEL